MWLVHHQLTRSSYGETGKTLSDNFILQLKLLVLCLAVYQSKSAYSHLWQSDDQNGCLDQVELTTCDVSYKHALCMPYTVLVTDKLAESAWLVHHVYKKSTAMNVSAHLILAIVERPCKTSLLGFKSLNASPSSDICSPNKLCFAVLITSLGLSPDLSQMIVFPEHFKIHDQPLIPPPAKTTKFGKSVKLQR